MKKKGFFANFIDKATLSVMSICSGRLSKEMVEEQYAVNKEAWKAYLEAGQSASAKMDGKGGSPRADGKGESQKTDDNVASQKTVGTGGQVCALRLIEDQSALTSFRYGTNKGRIGKKLFNGKEMTGADNTCEVIAVYNAMTYLAMQSDDAQAAGGHGSAKTLPGLPELIRSFSKKGIAYRGMFGTNPKAMKEYLVKRGYTVEELCASKLSRKNCEKAEKNYRAFILTTFNEGQNPFSMVHTMCVTKNVSSAGTVFQLHNDYEGSKEYASLYEAAIGYNNGKGHPITLLCVGAE